MASLRKEIITRDILLGFALLGGFLLIHRLVSNKMIEETDEK